MTLSVRNDTNSILAALVAAHNARTLDGISTFFHLTQYETVSGDFANPVITRPAAPATVTVDTVGWALIQTLIPQISSHFADMVAHDTVISTASTYTTGDVTDTASACTVLNDLKAVLNVSYTQAGAHYTDDNVNTVTSADATDDATMQVLLNELVAGTGGSGGGLYAHWASAPTGTAINIVPA
jgi:hypothetical protein